MINVLVGAVIGAGVNAAAYTFIQLWRGRPIERNRLIGALVGGMVAGALAGTTMGASLLGGTSSAALQFLAFDGAAAASAEKMTENALEGKPLGEGVGEAAAWGAITAPVTGLVLRGVRTEFVKLASEARLAAAANATTEATKGAVGKAVHVVGDALAKHSNAPSMHALGTMIANSMFGSPWVGEAVKRVKSIHESPPTPVSPHGNNAVHAITVTSDTTAESDGAPASPTAGLRHALERVTID